MTVDVDSWSSLLRFYSIKHEAAEANSEVGIDYGINRLLELFRRHDISATFFVPGEVAKTQQESIRRLLQEGHELGCHGLTHDKNEFLSSYNEQLKRIKEATELLEKHAGLKPKGFRAPCLRANGETIKALEALNYIYDSSVLPSFIPVYGSFTFRLKPYNPSRSSIVAQGRSRILELPVSVNPFFRIPLSAAWMRNLGLKWVKNSIQINFDLGNPVVFYVHPRDVTPLPKAVGLPWHFYRNIGLAGEKMVDEVVKYARKNGELVSGIELAERCNKMEE
jgi:peptidoglycan/xylan/chitin deacetylase (PgdA/CDA1 family)